jgi:WXG100 family type VII secretion target
VGEQKLSPIEIRQTADEFARAGRDSQAIVNQLEKSIADLEKAWAGVSGEIFYGHYKDWRVLMQGHIALLLRIAQELQALAERYERVDR